MSGLNDLLSAARAADINSTTNAVEAKYANDSYYDYIVLELSREFGNKLAFKGGYMLTKLISDSARGTVDVDLSILTNEIYEDIKVRLSAICEKFINDGIIDRYTIKPEVLPRMSGGVDMYRDNVKIMGVDVGWHDISYGTTLYNINGEMIQGFTITRMISDKVTAILSRKRFRRVKDLYDVYVISSSFDINMSEVLAFINKRQADTGVEVEWHNYPFTSDILREYKKAYDKLVVESVYLNRIVEKPSFEEAYERYSTLVESLIRDSNMLWSHSQGRLKRL